MGMEEAPDGAPRIDESGARSKVYRCYSDVETLERGVCARLSPLRDSGGEACVVLLFGGMGTEQETNLHGERRLVEGPPTGTFVSWLNPTDVESPCAGVVDTTQS